MLIYCTILKFIANMQHINFISCLLHCFRCIIFLSPCYSNLLDFNDCFVTIVFGAILRSLLLI